MPYTYNGVGTRYHGKKNLLQRSGTCRSCGRAVQLASYDTRLWFVFLFIPIIPLGRKRIMDFCPSCRRHYVADLEKWETARQLEISGVMEKFRSSPTPEGAIAVHQQLLGFHQIDEAAEFQKTMLAQFPDNARVHAYLGGALQHLGQPGPALELYKRALALRSDLPEARVGVARGYMRAGQLDEARKLLDFLETTGAAQFYSIEPLETLAHAYQAAGRHQAAFDLFSKLLEALPKIGEFKAFRDAVKKSEEALARDRTILPAQSFWKSFTQAGRTGGARVSARSLMAVGVILALIALGFVISNEYIRRHRTLYLLNGFKQPATVSIAGAGSVEKFTGVRTIALGEGRFHAVITGPVKQEIDFELRDGYFDRWFGDALWVINVGGGALIEETTAVYSANPQPATIAFHFGQPFQKFAGVTHPFTPLPNSVQVQSGGTRTLVEIQQFNGDAVDVLNYYIEKRDPNRAMTFADDWLRVHPEDINVLRLYAAFAQQQKQSGRLDACLRAGITIRPVRVEWNRVYQTLHDRPAERADMIRQYDAMLQAEPDSSALMYLRGRIELDRAVALGYYRRAAAADPRNPFPPYALGYDRMAAGDWAGAKPLFTQAFELDATDAGFGNWLFLTRLALGETPSLEQELRKQLAHDPFDFLAETRLIDVLAAREQFDEALKIGGDFASRCRAKFQQSGEFLANAIQYRACYSAGNFEKLKTAANADRTAAGRLALASAMIEQGQVDDAVKLLPPDLDSDERENFQLAIAVAYRQSGNPGAAGQWQQRFVDALQNGNGASIQAAGLLTRSTPPARKEVEDVAIPPQLKATILAALCQQHPQARAELAALARELNVERVFPFYLVRKVITQGP